MVSEILLSFHNCKFDNVKACLIDANNIQIYAQLQTGKCILKELLACIKKMKAWMSVFLRFNDKKDEGMLFGPPKSMSGFLKSIFETYSNKPGH